MQEMTLLHWHYGARCNSGATSQTCNVVLPWVASRRQDLGCHSLDWRGRVLRGACMHVVSHFGLLTLQDSWQDCLSFVLKG